MNIYNPDDDSDFAQDDHLDPMNRNGESSGFSKDGSSSNNGKDSSKKSGKNSSNSNDESSPKSNNGPPSKPRKNENPSPLNRGTPKPFDRRVQELDREGDALSMAEEASRDAQKQGQRIGREQSDASQDVSFSELSTRPRAEIEQLASGLGVSFGDNTKTHQLIYMILRERLKSNGMMFGEGTLEILPDGFGFLRSSRSHFLSSSDDIYVSPSQIRRFGLNTGVTVAGQIRPPKNEEKYFALLRVEAINRQDPKLLKNRKPFEDLTPLHPDTLIKMETVSDVVETRVVDLIAPIGFGQRGLIVSPPRAGKTMLLQKMARAILTNYPNAFVIVLLIDERPEEVTDMQREVARGNCEVVSSTFDEPASRHVQVANMVLEKAKRQVEFGTDVIILLDSITRLARAWNSECPQSGKTLSGGVDANAMQKPKAFFGSARKVEEGGSLTILATALIDTGSRMDDVIFEEFKGTGNMEIVLDRSLVDKRIWPAIDIHGSGTRREEMLLGPEKSQLVSKLRRSVSEINTPDAMEQIVNGLRKTKDNDEYLKSFDR